VERFLNIGVMTCPVGAGPDVDRVVAVQDSIDESDGILLFEGVTRLRGLPGARNGRVVAGAVVAAFSDLSGLPAYSADSRSAQSSLTSTFCS
jgi:hypothetical protein